MEHMPRKQDILDHRDQILAIASRYGASQVRLFGSVARGDDTPDSDVDFLVRFEQGRSLLDQGGLLMELRGLLGMKVDLLSEGALTGRFGEHVQREAIPL
jgi:predicted nucleotidyltransferase